MMDQGELLAAEEGGAQLRGRRARIAILAVPAALILVLLVVVRGNGGGSRLATESRPSDDPVVCDPLAPDQPYCVHQPDPTSTTIDTTVPSVTTPPTTLPPTTVPPAPQPLRLEGRDGTLRVTVDLDSAAPPAGQVVRVDVRIVEVARRTYSGVDFGDGARYGMPGPPRVSCGGDPATTTTTAQGPEREATETAEHAYRVPGEYHIRVKVVSADCTDNSEVELTGTVVVGPGVTLSNGPLSPVVVGARQLETPPGPNAIRLNVHVRDPDGFLTGVTVKWGDGNTESKQYQLADCIDPKTYWPGPTADSFTLQHTYGNSGAYEVEVVVSSSGCGGGAAQTANKVVTVTAAT